MTRFFFLTVYIFIGIPAFTQPTIKDLIEDLKLEVQKRDEYANAKIEKIDSLRQIASNILI